MPRLSHDALLQAVDIPALVERARSDGWTISYESDTGNYCGVATRGRVRLEALGDTVPDAIWRVLQKTHLSPDYEYQAQLGDVPPS